MLNAHRRTLHNLVVVALAALVLSGTGTAQAQWKWRDKDGKITVSDRPPPRDIADKDILTRPAAVGRSATAASPPASAASTAAPDAGRTTLDKEVEARRKAAEQEQASKTKADEARQATRRAENCQRARSHVASLESGQRVARMNDKGEREVLDDKAREDEMRVAREVIASECR